MGLCPMLTWQIVGHGLRQQLGSLAEVDVVLLQSI
jgi:hypothetical protein